jgi:hypothetical protein
VESSHYLLRKRTTRKHVWKQIVPDTGKSYCGESV